MACRVDHGPKDIERHYEQSCLGFVTMAVKYLEVVVVVENAYSGPLGVLYETEAFVCVQRLCLLLILYVKNYWKKNLRLKDGFVAAR